MTDVLKTLQSAIDPNDKTKISVPASLFGAGAIETVIQAFVQGQTLVIKPFTLTGDSVTAKLGGSGQVAPFGDTTIASTFTAKSGSVSMDLSATIQPGWSLATAFPGAPTVFPFDKITISQATLELDADSGEKEVELTATVTTAFGGGSAGQGDLIVQDKDGTLGYLIGVFFTGSFSLSDTFPILDELSVTEAGIFLSTISKSGLSINGKTLNFPASIDPGLTLFGSLALEGKIVGPLTHILPAGTTLDLLGTTTLEDKPTVELKASLTETTPSGFLQFKSISLDFKETGGTSGSITATISGMIVDKSYGIDITVNADATLAYSDTGISGTLGIDGSWPHPLGIQSLTINDFGVSVGFSDGVVNLAVGGSFTVGQTNPVTMEIDVSIADLELPDGIVAELSSADKGKSVTLGELIDDFIPGLDAASFPLLQDISFQKLMLAVVADQFTVGGKTFFPGIGAAGDVDFFGFDLDFSFTLDTQSDAVKAFGSISDNGGPIVLDVAGIQLLNVSDSTGTKGPCGCIDTSGSDFCKTDGCKTTESIPSGAYFLLDGDVEFLGLNDSLFATASKDVFEFDMNFDFLGLTESVSADWDLTKPTFDGSFGLNDKKLPDDIVLGPLKLGSVTIIPEITIPVPKVDLSIDVGTDPSPHFDGSISFSFADIDFDISIDIDLATAEEAFKDFGTFLLNWLKNEAKDVFNDFLQAAEDLAKLLYKLGEDFVTVIKAVAAWFGKTIEEVFDDVKKVFDELGQCAVDTANAVLGT
ncbi:MAG: hypothetical protein AAGC60_19645 [Acidobacteriota bacterium]